MIKPLVSIIIPTYNRAPLLLASLDSVVQQTYTPTEIIVVDDGSTDGSERLVKERFGDRVIWHRHAERKGAAAARNTGIWMAKGSYIAFQDSDDEWLPRKLERQMDVFLEASAEVGVVYCRLDKVISGKSYPFPQSSIKKVSGDLHRALLQQNLVGTPTAVVRRDCFEKSGFFDESLPRLQDWDLFIRLSKYVHFKYIDESLLIVRERRDSQSADPRALIRSIESLMSKYASEFASLTVAESAARYKRLGRMLAAEGEYAMARRYWAQAMKQAPMDIRIPAVYVASFAGKRIHRIVWQAKNRLIQKKAGAV